MKEKENAATTIRVMVSTRNRLAALAKWGEDLNGIINKLIDFLEANGGWK